MVNEQPRVVTRVRDAQGHTFNVRNEELDKYLADNPGTERVDAPNEGETVAEPQAEAAEKPADGDDAPDESRARTPRGPSSARV